MRKNYMFYIILLPRFISTVWNLYNTQQDLRNTKKIYAGKTTLYQSRDRKIRNRFREIISIISNRSIINVIIAESNISSRKIAPNSNSDFKYVTIHEKP